MIVDIVDAEIGEPGFDVVRAAQNLKVDWEPMQAPFPAMDQLYEHIRGAKVVKRQDEVKKTAP